jgi:hypothetical protein
MGDWEDLCESLGLTAAAQWEEVERRLFAGERSRSVRSTLPPAKLSEADRPGDLPLKVIAAFQAAGIDYPREVELLQYVYRFTLPTGGRFDVWYERFGRPTVFSSFAVSDAERVAIRQVLQLHLPRPCPSERGVWHRTREREMRTAFEAAGFEGLWIDHKPLKTQVVLRKTRYSSDARTPALDKSKRWGMVIIDHDPATGSKLVGEWGQPEVLQRLKDGLVVFGLLGVPGAEREDRLNG